MDTLGIKKIKLPQVVAEAIKDSGGKNIAGYEMDDCKIIVSKDKGLWHFSISHPFRYPFPDEIEKAKSILFSSTNMEIKAISQSNYAIHLFEIKDKSLN